MVALAEYPSKAAFMQMMTSAEWAAIERHRTAGLAGQLNIRTVARPELTAQFEADRTCASPTRMVDGALVPDTTGVFRSGPDARSTGSASNRATTGPSDRTTMDSGGTVKEARWDRPDIRWAPTRAEAAVGWATVNELFRPGRGRCPQGLKNGCRRPSPRL